MSKEKALSVHFVIPGRPITKKNSQRIITVNGRPMILPSKAYKQYESAAYDYLPSIDTISEPVNVQCIYYMPDRRKCDLSNLIEATHDVLTHWDVLEDDNSRIIVSVDGSRVRYDKENPRVEITITGVDDVRPR